MAKRFDFIRKSSKKLKLDVSVNPSYFSTNASNIADLWGSDDDDFILLATQLEEKQTLPPGETQPKDEELRFSQFVPRENTSTQQKCNDLGTTSNQCPVSIPNHLPPNLSMQEIFRSNQTTSVLSEIEEFQRVAESDGTNQWTDSSSQVTADRRQRAQERQLKFLIDRVDVLKKENTKLQNEIIKFNSQTVTKDGEVSLLRSELRQARKLLQASKMDKIVMAEEAEKDCNKKVAEVFKQVLVKNAELSFTNVEFSEHKIRNSKSAFNEKNVIAGTHADLCRNMLRMENLCINRTIGKENLINSDQYLYDYCKDTRAPKKQRNFFEVELEQLLFHYGQFTSLTRTDEAIMDRLIMSVRGVFTEFWSYTQSLELPQYCLNYAYHHFDLQLDQRPSLRRSLIQHDALYKLERAVLLRRYIATLALICQRNFIISQALLEKKHGNNQILQIVIQAIIKLSYSLEVHKHFGVIEATGALLHSLLFHINAGKILICDFQEELLFNLLKQLVFTRPSPWVFQKLSLCMLLCTRQSQLMSKMCVSCTHDCFVSNRVRSVYRFGPKSCLIQVYAGLLELCICSDVTLQSNHFKLLLSICGNHVRFVYQCFTLMPDFILKMLPLPSFVDDEKYDETVVTKVVGLKPNTASSHNDSTAVDGPPNISELPSVVGQEQMAQDQGCECYVKLCLSVVTLVFQMMFQWTQQEEKTNILEVSEISQIAVHLLILIFREYYLPNLFRDSEETTKHNLSLLCTWWNDYNQILHFEDAHVLFLKQLQDLQFMLKPLHQESNPSNPDNDLTEWRRFVKNSDAKIQKYDSPDAHLNIKSLFSLKATNYFSHLKTTAYNVE